MTDPKRHAPRHASQSRSHSRGSRARPTARWIVTGDQPAVAENTLPIWRRVWRPGRGQPSDIDEAACASVAAHVAECAADNILPPVKLDVTWANWPVDAAAAILSMNMIHIAPWEACLGLLDGAARVLSGDGAILYFYGPFKRSGKHTAPSNEAFDRSLRAQNPHWGIRDLDAVTAEAETRGLALAEIVDMPSHNLSVIFTRTT